MNDWDHTSVLEEPQSLIFGVLLRLGLEQTEIICEEVRELVGIETMVQGACYSGIDLNCEIMPDKHYPHS